MPPKPKPKVGGMGGMAVGLGAGGLMLAGTLGSAAINAGAGVGGAAIAADVLKDLIKNPLALAAVAGVVLLVVLK